MPGLPFVDHEAAALGCSCSRSRTADQMCRQQSRVCLTAAEELAAEESLSIYCKPVEFYNILQRRAIRKPSFLQRCLQYKIQAKHKRRIQVIISVPGNMNSGQQQRNIFPMYVILVRPIANISIGEQAAVYGVCRSHILSSFYEYGRKDTEVTFVIPEIRKLSTARGANLNMVIVSIGEAQGTSDENHLPEGGEYLNTFPAKLEGNCFWGKVPIESLYSSLEKCVTLSLGHRSEMISTIDMHPSTLKSSFLDQHNCLNFRNHNIDSLSSYKVQVNLCAQEVGARERSPYDSYTYNDVPASTLPHIIRLRSGNVLFNYRYYNNKLQKTEVTEDFSCPFCLVQCASFKGLRYHLCTCHDLFNFEFWVTEEYQAVNVSVRTDVSRSEALLDGVDPRLQTFFYWRRRRLKNLAQNINHIHPHVVELDSPEGAMEGSEDGYLQKGMDLSSSCRPISYPGFAELPNGFSDGSSYKVDEKVEKSLYGEAQLLSTRQKSESYGSENHHVVECTERITSSPDTATFCVATAQASTSNDCTHPLSGGNSLPSSMLQFAKTRRLSVERADPRSRALLTKRQFFHSHRAQPMALEQVFSDHDSEDEVDDDIADFEDRRMLDDFVDVTKDEKHIMHLWNSFVRKQRVLLSAPQACTFIFPDTFTLSNATRATFTPLEVAMRVHVEVAACALALVVVALTLFASFASSNSEGDALYALRRGLSDPENVLQSWDRTLVNPCTWFHITCNQDNRVTRLDLGNSNLVGQLVPYLGKLEHLQYLELYKNDIQGTIPAELGNLKNLISLDLYNNNISGSIPPALGKMKSLVFLRLNNNNLSGRIPRELAEVSGLKVVDVSNNNLCGTIPTTGSFEHIPLNNFENNPRLEGPELLGLASYDTNC